MKRETATLTCDVPGNLGEHGAERTIRFGIGGETYEADLCGLAAAALAEAFAPFIARARPAGKTARPARPARKRDRSRAERNRSAAVRAWAREQGIKVSDHGRMPAALLAKYEAAQAAAQAGAVISARRR